MSERANLEADLARLDALGDPRLLTESQRQWRASLEQLLAHEREREARARRARAGQIGGTAK